MAGSQFRSIPEPHRNEPGPDASRHRIAAPLKGGSAVLGHALRSSGYRTYGSLDFRCNTGRRGRAVRRSGRPCHSPEERDRCGEGNPQITLRRTRQESVTLAPGGRPQGIGLPFHAGRTESPRRRNTGHPRHETRLGTGPSLMAVYPQADPAYWQTWPITWRPLGFPEWSEPPWPVRPGALQSPRTCEWAYSRAVRRSFRGGRC